MAKRATKEHGTASDTGSAGSVRPRQPCPCGSGKRYKVCHGGGGDVMVLRPFEGLPFECELVALREFVPSALTKLPLAAGLDREITLATVLPMAASALVRNDGVAMVGMQVQTRSGDISRDLARAIRWASTAAEGESLPVVGPDTTGGTERLQDLLRGDGTLDITLHSDFSWWLPEGTEATGDVATSLERANAAVMPTERVEAEGVEAAYWVDAGEKAHLRWVRPEPEEKLLAALARLSVRGQLALDEDSRFAGAFRAHGLLVPVWDLDPDKHAREWAQPTVSLGERLTEALESVDAEPLSEAERRSRDGLLGRLVTLR